MAVVREHFADDSIGGAQRAAELPTFGEWSVGPTGAQVALARGEFARAVELVLPSCPHPSESRPTADHVRALDVLAQARFGLGDHAAALDAATLGLDLAEAMGFGAVVWRLRTVRASALSALGNQDDAATEAAHTATEFRTLADRIVDPDLRAWFERQPLAPSG